MIGNEQPPEPSPEHTKSTQQPVTETQRIGDVEKLIALEERTAGLGAFLHLLQRSNEIRETIENGDLHGLSSKDAFEKIWSMHTGDTSDEEALAYSEGGGYTVEEWRSKLKSTVDSMQYVREIEDLPPMLFTLPEPPKQEITDMFFEMTDGLIADPQIFKGMWTEASLSAAVLQAQLRWLHPKMDGNGRSAEDWMLWYQNELVLNAKHKAETPEAGSSMTSLSIKIKPVPVIRKDSIRCWYRNGLRSKYSKYYPGSPPFLSDGYVEEYKRERDLMELVTREQNAYRRNMYRYLAEELGYEGLPADFPNFIQENASKVTDIFHKMYEDINSLYHFDGVPQLGKELSKTGGYEYTRIEPEDAIKPKYLET